MLLHSSEAAKRNKSETSVPEDTVISGDGERLEWSFWTCMVPLSFRTKGDWLSAVVRVLLSAETNQMAGTVCSPSQDFDETVE